MKNQLNDFRGIFVYRQIKDFFVPLIGTASLIQAIAIRNRAACIKAALCKLLQPGLGAYRSLDTLTRRLPVAYVVQQLIYMIVKPLLSLCCTPNFNSISHKPLNNERSFIILAAQAVKHIDQKNIKLSLYRVTLKLLDGVSFFCRFLKAGNAFLVHFLFKFPIRVFCNKSPAKLSLHRDVVFLNLSYRRYTIKAIDSHYIFHNIHLIRYGNSVCILVFSISLSICQGTLHTIIIAFFSRFCKK